MHNPKAPRYIRVVVVPVLMLWTLVGANVTETATCIVALDDRTATTEGMAQLAQDLRAHAPERALFTFPFAPAPTADADTDALEPVRAMVAQARRAYTGLDTAAVFEAVREGLRRLGTSLVSADAVDLAAELHRLEGLTHSYLDHPTEAARAFALAWALEPDFAPTSSDWPPAARLAYADAVSSRRQRETGALLLEVQPPATRTWIDGKPVALGSATLAAIDGGEHWLVAKAPGHEPFAAIVQVEGHERSSKLEVRLVPTSGAQPGAEAARALQQRWGTTDEAAAGAQLALIAGSSGVIVVAASEARPTEARAWLLDRTGVRRAEGLVVVEATTAEQLAGLLAHSSTPATLALTSEVPTAPVGSPWYAGWLPWTVAAAVVGSAAITYFVVREDEPERIRLLVGRP